jgi:vacuolar-type H+-ATPase subunit I/STV1
MMDQINEQGQMAEIQADGTTESTTQQPQGRPVVDPNKFVFEELGDDFDDLIADVAHNPGAHANEIQQMQQQLEAERSRRRDLEEKMALLAQGGRRDQDHDEVDEDPAVRILREMSKSQQQMREDNAKLQARLDAMERNSSTERTRAMVEAKTQQVIDQVHSKTGVPILTKTDIWGYMIANNVSDPGVAASAVAKEKIAMLKSGGFMRATKKQTNDFDFGGRNGQVRTLDGVNLPDVSKLGIDGAFDELEKLIGG